MLIGRLNIKLGTTYLYHAGKLNALAFQPKNIISFLGGKVNKNLIKKCITSGKKRGEKCLNLLFCVNSRQNLTKIQ
jgi:hypothetical protein